MPTAKADPEGIKKIASLGEQFQGKYLFDPPVLKDDPLVDIGHDPKNAKRRSEIEGDWYEGLQFFLSKAFYGRLNDEIMLRFYRAAKKVLDETRDLLMIPAFNLVDLDAMLKT